MVTQLDLSNVMTMSRLLTFGDVPASAYREQERDPSTGYDGNRSVGGLGDLDGLDNTIRSQLMMGRVSGMSSCGGNQKHESDHSTHHKFMWVFALIIAAFVFVSWKHHTSSAHHHVHEGE